VEETATEKKDERATYGAMARKLLSVW